MINGFICKVIKKRHIKMMGLKLSFYKFSQIHNFLLNSIQIYKACAWLMQFNDQDIQEPVFKLGEVG